MRYIVDDLLENFKPWGGARDTFQRLTLGELRTLDDYLDEIPFLSETDVNDFLWFDTEIIFNILGIDENAFWEREPRPFHWWE